MIEIDIPGRGLLRLEHLVLDYNGTLACDGELLPGVREVISVLAGRLTVHVVTGDTFGKARAGLSELPCNLVVLAPHDQAAAKLRYMEQFDPARCVAIGNGRNDRLMLEHAALGVAVIQAEGAAIEALLAADVAAPDMISALGLLLEPVRLVATLRD